MYIVEDYDKIIRTGIPLSTLLQASVNSLVQDDFIVKYTDSHQDSMSYLATLTSTLCKIYTVCIVCYNQLITVTYTNIFLLTYI